MNNKKIIISLITVTILVAAAAGIAFAQYAGAQTNGTNSSTARQHRHKQRKPTTGILSIWAYTERLFKWLW